MSGDSLLKSGQLASFGFTISDLNYFRSAATNDFLFSGNTLIIAGSFDSANHYSCANLARYKITGTGTSNVSYTSTGNGNWTDASNRLNNTLPPALLPAEQQIIMTLHPEECAS